MRSVMSRQPVWPDAEIESSPNFSLAAQKVKIRTKESNNSIKSTYKQMKKRNPKILKKTQTSNV